MPTVSARPSDPPPRRCHDQTDPADGIPTQSRPNVGDAVLQSRTQNGLPKLNGSCPCGGTLLAIQLVMDPPQTLRVCGRCGTIPSNRFRS